MNDLNLSETKKGVILLKCNNSMINQESYFFFKIKLNNKHFLIALFKQLFNKMQEKIDSVIKYELKNEKEIHYLLISVTCSLFFSRSFASVASLLNVSVDILSYI